MRRKINLIPSSSNCVMICSQGDTGLRQFEFEVYAGDDRWSIDCDRVEMQLSNGSRIEGTVENNVVGFDCDISISEKAGEFYGKLMFEKGEQILYSASFILLVEVKP